MDMIIGPVLEIAKLAWGPIGRRIGYIKNLKKNMKELDRHDLFAARDDVLDKINSNKPNGVCNKWLENVKQIEVEVNAIREEFKEDKKCLIGWCPNIYSRMKLGKPKNGLEFDGKELPDAPLEKVLLQNVESNSLTATERTLKEILMFIEDDNTKMIGVWGMGGVGKTTTMKLLNDRLEGSPAFEIVIWVTVSKARNRRNVQNAIAERLKFTKSESDDQLKASICKALRRKKFLLLLDDIWEMIDLSDVGIPPLNQVDGCKVVLTTRSLKVCRQMKTNKDVKVETLSKDEAWNLFIKSAGDVAMTSNIKQLAEGIVKECGGLPLAINVVGSSLRNNDDVVVWRNTLRELQSPTTSENEDMEEKVFPWLRSSYELLKDDSKKKLFLYCSLYPEDNEILINDLVEYCWLEGYIHGVRSIEDARDKGHCMVIGLVDTALLERCRREGYVKMHDIVRDFALREAHGFLVKAGMNMNHPLEEKEWLQSQKISLMKSNLCNLLERPNCSTLSTLLLQDNHQLTMIPDPFFECMHSLCILDLSGTEIKSLPSSLCNLVNLRGLYLKDCRKLEELPSQVGALRQLEVLHLGGSTSIKYLPREVEELTCLKRLIVGFQNRNRSRNDDEDTKEWNMKLRVPTGIIPKLQLLEELSLCTATQLIFVHECVEKEQWDDESMEVIVKELCRLEHLTYLDAYFPKVECLEHFLRHSKSVKATSSRFRRFRFRVGTEITDRQLFCNGGEGERCLLYNGGFGTSHAAIMETLARCSDFHLKDHRTSRKLSELGLANMNELKECWVETCEKMETLFDGDEKQEACALLPNLERLNIMSLPELRSLCDGPLLLGSLSKLRFLRLYECRNLKKVFQLGIIRQLCSLEFLKVLQCSNMEEIIEIEEEEEMSMSVASHTHNVISYNNDRLILPNIKDITLRDLPELVSICGGFSNFEWPSLETIQIIECPKLKSLSFLSNGTNIVAPALKKIKGKSSWWEALEWEDNDIKQRLQPLFVDQRF
ncbi:putative disease resistance protein [Cinnamomum micranthum f. kanehirae]|uniref:Putative disease resistance protein n=1 Tax=Cinnamomum micranthum f. kanehirae TaxID=337451 RepID=A0A443Q3T0_9MAGN|nr:putative disease resistance protein [Cinnamomum micranthum f. kanehirae]